MKRLICKIVYMLFVQYLPVSYRPGGKLMKKLRYWCAKGYMREVGKDVNIDRCAAVNWDVSIGDRSGIGAYSTVMGG